MAKGIPLQAERDLSLPRRYRPRIRSAGKVTGLPVLAAVGVLANGEKRLLSLEAWSGSPRRPGKGSSNRWWRGCEDPLAVSWTAGRAWQRRRLGLQDEQGAALRRAQAPEHRAEGSQARPGGDQADYHRIVYAKNEEKAREAYTAFEKKWARQCPGVVAGFVKGNQLITFFSFPKSQWKALRTTNVIERLNEEFRRRVKTQCSFPDEDSATALLFALVASGRIKLRRIDGWKALADVFSLHHRAQPKQANRKPAA